MRLLTIVAYLLYVCNIGAYEITVPSVRPKVDDDYICTAKYVGDEAEYITGFEPIYNRNITHHMILHACKEPVSWAPYWHCNMAVDHEGVCGESVILFSWADNAPRTEIPEGVSFPIGTHGRKYLVLQVHYKDVAPFTMDSSLTDSSGYKLTMQSEPTEKLAGIYFMVSGGQIPPHSKTNLQIGCMYSGKVPMHPFAFRVHAHSHGVIIDGYVVHENKKYLIGEKSPQLPQTYYPVNNASMVIVPGDIMIAKCVMENNEDRLIKIGMTRKDEMCNFYMMYWVYEKDSKQLFDTESQVCFSDGQFNLDKFEKSFSKMKEDFEESLDQMMDNMDGMDDVW